MHIRAPDLGLTLAFLLTALLAAVAARAESSGGVRQHVDDAVPTTTPGAPVRIWTGFGTGHRFGSGALLLPSLSISLPVFKALEPELVVAEGVDSGGFDLQSAAVVSRFSFGLRWFVPVEGGSAFDVDAPVRPFLWTALHHGHAISLENTIKSPLGALLTSSEAGTEHFTGAEGGLGVLFGLPIDGESVPLLLRAGVSYLPSLAFVHDQGSAPPSDRVLAVVDVSVGLPVRLSPGL